MTKTFRAKLLKAGALDTAKYRYAVYHGHAYDVIKRIKKPKSVLGTPKMTNIGNL
jgi:hypothetical protein